MMNGGRHGDIGHGVAEDIVVFGDQGHLGFEVIRMLFVESGEHGCCDSSREGRDQREGREDGAEMFDIQN